MWYQIEAYIVPFCQCYPQYDLQLIGAKKIVLGAKKRLLDGSISIKFLLKTRLKSESLILRSICWDLWSKSYDLK